MTKARTDGLLLMSLGSVLFVVFGIVLEASSPATMGDFRMQYFPARCTLEYGDPYNENHVLRTYRAERGSLPEESLGARLMTTEYIYPPTTLTFTLPLATLPYRSAQLVWMLVSLAGLVVAGFLIWDLAAVYAPEVSGALIGFLLANSELTVTNGNVAGIAISMSAIAAWCFVKERWVALGVLCMAAGLMLKPHDTWLVWLYFLLAGGAYRKRALQALGAFVILSLPAVAWVTHVAPHWLHELRSNMEAISARGGTDPSLGAHGPSMIIDLQAAISFFRNDPRMENVLSYFICGAILLVWCAVTVRSRPSLGNAWLGLASVAALTILPVYHREVDAKVLLLTIPACAMLRCQGGRVGRVAMALTAAGLFVTADIPWAIDVGLLRHFAPPDTRLSGRLLVASQVVLVPLVLLIEGVFFLWVYAARLREQRIATAV